MVGYIVAALVLLPVAGLALLSAISRRPENLGATNGRLAVCPDSPNCVSSQESDELHRVDALRFEADPESAWRTLQDVLSGMPRLRVTQRTDDYLACESTSLLFRFVDDVEFVLDRKSNCIHVRSASRVGRSDLGVNRARVEEIRRQLDSALK